MIALRIPSIADLSSGHSLSRMLNLAVICGHLNYGFVEKCLQSEGVDRR
jgi:hypothetical protein